MSSPDYSQAVKDIIDGLGDSPTPDAIYHAVRNYSVDNVVAAAASAAKAGGGGGGGGSLPDAAAEGVVLRAGADLAAAWSDVLKILDNQNVVVYLLGVDDDPPIAFLEIDSSGRFGILNSDGEKIVDIRTASATLGGTTGVPHQVVVNGLLGAVILDGLGNIAVQVDPDGNLLLPSIPTSNPGVAGAVWNNAGTLKISAG